MSAINSELPPSNDAALNAYLDRSFTNVKHAVNAAKTHVVTALIKNPSQGKLYLVTSPTTQFPAVGLYYYSGVEFKKLSEAEQGNTTVSLGVLHTQAFYGDLGHIAYDHTFNANNPHKVTAAQVGLGKVDNTSDKDKPVSIATAAELSKYVPGLRTINGKTLTNNVALTTANVPPSANRWYLTYAELTGLRALLKGVRILEAETSFYITTEDGVGIQL